MLRRHGGNFQEKEKKGTRQEEKKRKKEMAKFKPSSSAIFWGKGNKRIVADVWLFLFLAKLSLRRMIFIF